MSPLGVPGPGSLLENRYRLDAVIARGGMSTVHLATDERLDRHVAVKLLDPALAADQAFVDRFTLEARSVARLSDPGIVQVFDQGVEEGYAFLVMELVPGGTLRELLDERGPMPPYAAAAVLRPLLSALREAHDAGLVHRDIKPENVLISANGAVKLADFGLVRAVAESRATSKSVVMGTAAYLSPEQISGTDTDGRSDLYSVGVLAYEMLTGHAPFTGENSVAVAYQRLSADVPVPSSHPEVAISQILDDFVSRATRRGRDDRFIDAQDMLNTLDEISDRCKLPPYTVPAPSRSSWTTAREAAAQRMAPGRESEFDVADRESGEAVERSEGPHPTRVHTRAIGAAPVSDPEPGPPAPARRLAVIQPSKQRGMLWLAVVILLAVLLGVAGWWLGSGRFTTVPSVQGMSVGEATSALTGVGLTAYTRDAYSDSIPHSSLVGTEPTAGVRIPRGDAVAVLVSAGRPTVPEIGADRSVDTVRDRISERSLRPEIGARIASDSVPVGQVVSLEPRPGQTVAVGTPVRMLLSSGPAPVNIPDVTKLDEDQARTALQGSGLRIAGTERVFDPEVPGGQAIGTDPMAGRSLPRGSAVTLRISNAREVPDVTGQTVEQARSILESAGFTVVIESAITDQKVFAGHVVRSSPEAGSTVDPADPVIRIVPSDSVRVPMVLGTRTSAAIEALKGAGLSPQVDTGTPRGLVYGQVPLPGRVVARGSEVELDSVG